MFKVINLRTSNPLFRSVRLVNQRSAIKLNQIRDYCYKQRDNQFNQWGDDVEPKDTNSLNKFKPKTKTGQLLRKQEEDMLSNLGLEKYVDLFEKNLKALKGESTPDEERQDMSFFEQFLNERQFVEHSLEDFEQFIDSDETRERIKNILKLYELEKYNTSQVPTRLTPEDIRSLLKTDDEYDQVKQLNYFFKREANKQTRKMRKNIDKRITEERLRKKHILAKNRTGLEYSPTGQPFYAKWKNTMFITFNKEALRKESERRIRDAILFGPRIVIDFGYKTDLFKPISLTTLRTQLNFCFWEIFRAKVPCDLQLCNLPKDGEKLDLLKKNLDLVSQTNCLFNLTDKSYNDLFPKSDLIYLTADAPKALEFVDPTKVHIIGGICDKFDHSDYSYQKARKENIPAYRLPLEDHFFFKHSRVLPMNLVIGILLKYIECKDWRQSFIGKIPVRKLKTPEELRLEQIRKVRKFYSKEKYFKIYKMNETDQRANKDGFAPNMFKSSHNSSSIEQPKVSPIYNPKHTPNFKIKYSPNQSSSRPAMQKHSINYKPRTQSNVIKNDDRN